MKIKKVEMGTDEQSLLPGLPDDIALDCIARVPHRFLPGLRPVCRRWRDLITAPLFRLHRERIGAAEDLIFLVQALVCDGNPVSFSNSDTDTKDNGKQGTASNLRPPIYALSVYYAADGSWVRLASPDPIPMFAQCATVGGNLVLVGGWNPATLDPVSDVRILDLVTGKWRKGRPMSADRSFFACGAVGCKVYVAGGHDGMKNALRTAEVYDLTMDEWEALPSMADERDESKGVALGGRFWAVSGYGTDRQGMFNPAVECYNPASGEWVREDGVWSEEGSASACFAGGGKEGLWCVGRRGVLREYKGRMQWREAAPGPKGMKGSACAAMCGGKEVFVMGSGDTCGEGSGGDYGGWVLETESGTWRRAVTPAAFSGFAYSAAAARI